MSDFESIAFANNNVPRTSTLFVHKLFDSLCSSLSEFHPSNLIILDLEKVDENEETQVFSPKV